MGNFAATPGYLAAPRPRATRAAKPVAVRPSLLRSG